MEGVGGRKEGGREGGREGVSEWQTAKVTSLTLL